MADIDVNLVNSYSNTVYLLARQKGSKLASKVRHETVNAEYAYFDQLGQSAAVEITTRLADTPFLEVPHERRRVALRQFVHPTLIDDWDKIRMLWDPTSQYAQAGMWAMGHVMDDLLIEAATGDVETGKAGGTTVSLPSSQRIAADYGSAGTNSGLTLEKIIAARQMFDEADIDPSLPRYFVCTPAQISELLADDTMTSADYNTVKALVSGEVNTPWVGFNFVFTNRLADVDSAGVRECFAFVQDGLILADHGGVTTKFAEMPTKNMNVLVHLKGFFGAVRMEEEKVVVIEAAES